jgi:hypothetical protein
LVELKNYIGGKFFKLNSHYYNLKIKVIFLSKKKKRYINHKNLFTILNKDAF